MKLNKIVSVLLVFVLISNYAVMVTFSESLLEDISYNYQNDAEKIEEQIKVNYKPKLEDDFKDDCVIIVLKHSYSKMNASFSVSDFNESTFSSVENLFYLKNKIDNKNNKINYNNFHQILSLKLKNVGKENVLAAIEMLEKRDDVLSAEPAYNFSSMDCYTPQDPSFTRQWGLSSNKGISIEKAWDFTKGNSNIKVGIFEKGISVHEDLNTIITGNQTSANTEHGTHVAGILGASMNNIGIAGVAQVSIACLSRDLFLDSLAFATDNGINILNASFYFTKNDLSDEPAKEIAYHKAAISNYSGLLVCAAGNSNKNIDQDKLYPASYNLPNIITVGAINSIENKWIDSNFGIGSVHIFAPGENIYSTYTGDSYMSASGTSMAAPFVTGVAALILSLNSNLTAEEIKNYILNSVDIVSSLNGLCITSGRLNAFRAVRRAAGYIMGDMDHNTNITAGDARTVLRISAGLFNSTGIQNSLADVDYDNVVSAADARMVLRISAELIPPIE